MTLSHQLLAAGLDLGYGDLKIVSALDLTVPPGKLTVIVGANACGKSTLLRGLARLLAPSRGAVYLDGKPIHQMPTRDVATVLGVLPQSPVAPDAIVVADLVGRGRYPHQGWFRRWTPEDDAAVAEALAATDTAELADRPVDELSGGQRQRVWIAMALAQQTDLLLLDEPTTFLDINHQVEVLDLLTDLVRNRGRTVVVVLHDLNLACRYADHIVAMKSGTIVAEGRPADVMTEAVVANVFGMASRIVLDPISATPLILPIGRHHVERAVTGERAG
ncbi:ABC transporter ATP-binding protein [Devosia sp. 63-57]|uniref:ABC transporter ATP-binding protein n=1 Tax=Devosia sp. 63-57 TaxID=1895751 RepID=UPI00086C2232|nr:ABC transporter ATP-binding protein [Devosia sp. 63-57]ODT49140.1 MAG: iron dicitrate ABC transporter ATP-binding protein [Pelagibacterium sp. SCN 63-126]ODU86074.1 MAG: iron dicitrate ABC transporter ATP-binding protein [Pelagibacterium sp. SCN 63-17]OJX43342.1 MAG: iron dicitrate ABC transporter ATP-binding protein [Devosia sp. 63-57]